MQQIYEKNIKIKESYTTRETASETDKERGSEGVAARYRSRRKLSEQVDNVWSRGSLGLGRDVS